MLKKILIFSLSYYPEHIGGAEVAIKQITDRLNPQNIKFYMVALRHNSNLPKVEKINNVTIHRIGLTKKDPSSQDLKKLPLYTNKLLYQFLAPYKASRLHKKIKFDALWVIMAHACGPAGAIFNLFYPNVPIILTLQEGDPPEYIEKKLKPLWLLFTRIFKKATIIQAISSFLAIWAKKFNRNANIEIIPNGVDIKKFSNRPKEQELEKLKKQLQKKSGDIYLITTSRLVNKNGIDTIIQALSLLEKNIIFLIIGSGPEQDKLKNLAKKLHVEKRVKFIGQISQEKIIKYLHIADIFVRPSRSEGRVNSFIEAMAAGLPVIATQEGGIADFLFDKKKNPDKPTTGWVVEKNNPEQITTAVKQILQNPEQTKKITNNAFHLVQKKHDWDKITADMLNKVFYKILNE